MTVIKCDKCGAIEQYENTYSIKCYKRSATGRSTCEDEIDVCENCRDQMMEQQWWRQEVIR